MRFLRIPHSKLGQLAYFGCLEAVSFFIICANTRALALGNYTWTGLTDFAFGMQGFIMAKLMVEDEKARTWYAGLGAAIGGVFGSWASIWITEHLYGRTWQELVILGRHFLLGQ